jgi:hypothetical protein
MQWKVGQQVYCLQNGYGVIDKINTDNGIYQIVATFPCLIIGHYLKDGRISYDDKTPMLYPSKPEIILPKWQPKEGEWCWFWDEKLYGAFLSKFEKMQDDVFFDWEGNCWQNCTPFNGELPEHLKEVQP